MSAIAGGGLFQNSVYVGITLQNILYGIELVLYFKTMDILLNHAGERTRSDVFYAIFSSVMLLMTTIWVFAQVLFCGKMWLLGANFAGGPDAFWETNISVWYIALARTAMFVLRLMTDALMIHRCWAVWNGYRVIIAPSILWIATFVLGILSCWTASTSDGGLYFDDIAAQFSLAYYSVSVFLTAMLTWMICYRLVGHGRLIKEHLAYEYASLYFAVVALVVESVLPSTLASIAFLITLGIDSEVMSAFGYVHALMMCVSPQMLILRVAMRAEWTMDKSRQLPSAIEFSPQEDVTQGSIPKGAEVLPVSTPSQKRDNDMV